MNKKLGFNYYSSVTLILGFICSSFLTYDNMILFNFDSDSDLSHWTVVNDVVMGGRSEATFGLNSEGNAVYEGSVSLENNGGFSSLRYRFGKTRIEHYKSVELHLKGDGKMYQFRIKTSKMDRHSYVYEFQSTDNWQVIKIPLSEMKPQFRGRKLIMPSFPGEEMQELTFLIGNKKEESFKLEIDSIKLI